ncbi:MAG: (2Fe-2S)-binding protein [Alphaproteobacteria bacterium]|nr:(2Fe-2S)-binding protein [Alphaproteobacteria bacterium]
MNVPLRSHILQCRVNGQPLELELTSAATLLHVLRNDCGLNGPKLGCGLGQCGACTVWVDGLAARSCCMPALEMQGREITTLEGLPADLQVVRQAFIDAQAAQCGYCLNGMIMMAAHLLRDQSSPSDADIVRALSANVCRCGTHVEIMQAVRLAAQRLTQGSGA